MKSLSIFKRQKARKESERFRNIIKKSIKLVTLKVHPEVVSPAS